MGLRLKAAGASGKPLSFKSFIKSHLGKKQPVSLVMIRGKQTDDLMARVQRVGDVDATSFIMTIRKPSEFSYRAVGAIIGSIGYAIIGTDEQQIIRRFSAAAELCFGYKNDEIIGKPFATLLPQDQHAAFKKYFQTIAKHNTIKPDIGIEGNVRARHKDGTEFSIMAHMASYGSGKQKIFTVVLRDIAFRIARTAEINRLAEQRRLAFENIVEGIVCFDKDNRLSAFNKQFLKIFRIPKSQIRIGDSWKDVVRLSAQKGAFGKENGVNEEAVLKARRKAHKQTFAMDELTLANGKSWRFGAPPFLREDMSKLS
jgi:PAS domain S-box-containing protein